MAGEALVVVEGPDEEGPSRFYALVEELHRRIVTHNLPPGARMREQALAKDFGVSRAQIREVLAALEERGLVEREPNRGAFVRRPTAQELLHVFELREVLEGLSARLATQQASPESWQDLVDLFGAPTEALVEAGDVAGYLRNLELMRKRMLDAAGNPVLSRMLGPLYDQTFMIMRRLLLTTDRAREALLEHRAILEAMRRGDATEAERLKRLQIRSARSAFERYRQFLL
ncbi:MAG: GntR family transcriptional regulator [Proteobacteria bacterium]|nr:GntR family transcriptional regulator [Pseudomonadota bacterium]